nr:hypothetical protein [Tanacetum cinerariifolium]
MNMALVLMAKIGYNAGNQKGYDAMKNVGNQVGQNSFLNLGIQKIRNQNALIVVLGVANQNGNGNGNVVAAQARSNGNGNNANKIRCYNFRGVGHYVRNCTVRSRRRDVAYH